MSLSPDRQSHRARSTLRYRQTPSPGRKKDSWTEFLRENAVTSLPPIELINRFRLPTDPRARPSPGHRLTPRFSALRRPLVLSEVLTLPISPHIRHLPLFKQRDHSTPSPEAVHSVVRATLKHLPRVPIESLSPRAAEIQRTRQSFTFVSPVLDPVVTVQSHLRHY